MWATIIPLVITCIVMLAIIKLMNNMLTFGTKNVVVSKEIEGDKKKSFNIWKIIKLVLYIVTGVSMVLILICQMNRIFSGKLYIIISIVFACCFMILSYFDNESKNK